MTILPVKREGGAGTQARSESGLYRRCRANGQIFRAFGVNSIIVIWRERGRFSLVELVEGPRRSGG